MATAQDVQNSERLLDLSNQLIDSINERRKALKKIDADEQLYLTSIKQQQKLSQDITANAENYLRYAVKQRDLNKQIDAAKKQQKKSEDAFIAIESKLITARRKATIESRNINTAIIKQKQELFASEQRRADLEIRKQIAISQGDVNSIAYLKDRIKDEAATTNAKLSTIDSLQKQLDKEVKIRDSAKETLKNEEKAKIIRKEEIDFLEKNLEIRKRIEKSTGALGALSKAAAKIPGIGQYLNAEEATEEMEKLAAEIEDKFINGLGDKSTSLGNRLKIGLKGASTLLKGFIENAKSPEAIFTYILIQATKANEQAVALGKTIGYGVDRADRLRENFAFIAGITPNINVNSKSIVEAFGELAKATGYVYQYSADQLTTQVKLTKQVGLQADEAAQIQRFAVLNGKTSEETYSSFVRGLTAARNQLRVGIDFKSALAEASKVSGQLAAQLGNNPELIAKAVVTAKALGMTLEQVAKAGSTLLDFGTSISSELEAELLTGKQLNLERARAAALAGDQVTLAEELAKNMGTAAEFTKLNKLQQDSLAKSIGMEANELAETLRKREEAVASGKSLVQINEEEAKQALERQTIQEKFGAALLKIQDVVGNLVAGPFGQLFDLISNIASIFTNIISPVITGISYVVGLIVEGFKTLSPILIGIGGLLAVIYAKSIATAIASVAENAFKGFSGFGPAGPVLATAATLAGVGLVTRLAKGTAFAEGGIVTGEINNATVGEAGPEAIIPLNSPKADKILGGGSMPQIDLTPMIMAINEVRAAVDRLYSKDQSINMDGKKVGNTLVQGSYKVA